MNKFNLILCTSLICANVTYAGKGDSLLMTDRDPTARQFVVKGGFNRAKSFSDLFPGKEIYAKWTAYSALEERFRQDRDASDAHALFEVASNQEDPNCINAALALFERAEEDHARARNIVHKYFIEGKNEDKPRIASKLFLIGNSEDRALVRIYMYNRQKDIKLSKAVELATILFNYGDREDQNFVRSHIEEALSGKATTDALRQGYLSILKRSEDKGDQAAYEKWEGEVKRSRLLTSVVFDRHKTSSGSSYTDSVRTTDTGDSHPILYSLYSRSERTVSVEGISLHFSDSVIAVSN